MSPGRCGPRRVELGGRCACCVADIGSRSVRCCGEHRFDHEENTEAGKNRLLEYDQKEFDQTLGLRPRSASLRALSRGTDISRPLRKTFRIVPVPRWERSGLAAA